MNKKNINISTIGSRFKYTRQVVLKLTQIEFANLIGMTQQNLSLIESDKTSPDFKKIARYAEIFNINQDWLIFGGDVDTIRNKNNIEIVKIPLFQRLTKGEYIMEVSQEFSHVDSALSRCFATKIKDDSMTSPHGDSLSKNTIIVVDPQKKPENNKFVAVSVNNEIMVRKYNVNNEKISFSPLNSSFRSFDEADVKILGTAVQKMTYEKM